MNSTMMRDSTTASPGSDGYGYLWWLMGEGVYLASGIYGQGIYIKPSKQLVIALHSAWPVATGTDCGSHRNALFRAIDAWLQ